MARHARPSLRSNVRIAVIAVVALATMGAILAARPPTHLRIESGPEGGRYHRAALAYKEYLAPLGITVDIIPRAASLEIVRDVANPSSGIDVGFVAQDSHAYETQPISSIGEIQLQPLFVFARAPLGRRPTINALRGRKIIMPPQGSPTSAAAISLLSLYDITPDNSSFTFRPLADAVSGLREGLFDAGFFMLGADNPQVRTMITDSSLTLVAVPEAQAIANQMSFLVPVTMPRGAYSIADAIPPANTPMVAATIEVIVRDTLHPYLVFSLMEAMRYVHRGATLLSPAGSYPTLTNGPIKDNPLAVQYYKIGLPWTYRELHPWLTSVVALYGVPIATVLVIAGLLFTILRLAESAWWPRRRVR